MKHQRSIISIAMATIVLLSLCAVYASTSVSAAQGSSNASVKAAPSLVGSPIAAGTGPAACILKGSLSLYVFVKGYDGALWYRIWSISTDDWAGGWTSLGGQLSSSPAAVSRDVGLIDVYVAGTNGAVYENFYNSAGWHTWASLGGQVARGTGPAVCSCGGHENVFVEGTNGALYQKTWDVSSGQWSGWTNLGGKLSASPAAVSRDIGLIDVYVRGTTGAVYETSYFNGAWHVWANLGGQVARGTGPAVCSYGATREDVFVEGTNGNLYQITRTSTGGYSNWVSLGGKLTSSPTAATYTFSGTMHMPVFVRGTNGLLYFKESDGVGWSSWTGPYQGPP